MPLEDVYVNEGETGTFKCKASRTNANVKWSHLKEMLYSGIKFETTNDETLGLVSLAIHDAETEDAGSYTVAIGDKLSTAKLYVKEADILVVQGPIDQTVKEKMMAKFEVKLNKANKEPVWLKNGVPLQREIGKTEFSSDGTSYFLTIKKCRPEVDDCEIGFKISEVNVSARLMVIASDPIFLETLKDVRVYEGERVAFRCDSDKENIKDSWKKDSIHVSYDDRVQNKGRSNQHILEISSAKFEDEGAYTCSLGKNSTTANLIVLGTVKGL